MVGRFKISQSCNTNNYLRIHIILCDVYFLGDSKTKDGVELVEMIRQFEVDVSSETHCFILAFSGDKSAEAKMIQSGSDVFLGKPLKRVQVINLVKSPCSANSN